MVSMKDALITIIAGALLNPNPEAAQITIIPSSYHVNR